MGRGLVWCPSVKRAWQQARQVAAHPALAGAQLVLSSPYTRALQTAAEIVRATGLPLAVESDLHELMADRQRRPPHPGGNEAAAPGISGLPGPLAEGDERRGKRWIS